MQSNAPGRLIAKTDAAPNDDAANPTSCEAPVETNQADKQASNVDDCAICLMPLTNGVVHLMCGHTFHAQCAVDALQHDRRCALCRKQPKRTADEIERQHLRTERFVARRLSNVGQDTLRRICTDFRESPSFTQNMTARQLRVCVATNLLCQTDEEASDYSNSASDASASDASASDASASDASASDASASDASASDASASDSASDDSVSDVFASDSDSSGSDPSYVS